MNNLAISPYLFMYALQLQNIKRETTKKIPVHQLNRNQEKKLESKEVVEVEEKEKGEKEEEETSTKIEDLVQNQVPSFEVKTEN